MSSESTKSEKPIPSSGSSLPLGVSERVPFHNESPDSLGMGRKEDPGIPTGKGRV